MSYSVIIGKSELHQILAALMKDYRVAAPVLDGDALLYAYVTDPAAVVRSDDVPYKSPKEFLFPQIEEILSFEGDEAVETAVSQPTVVFDVRPCDLGAFRRITDRIFSGGQYGDAFYQAHRDSTVFIGMPCERLKPGCFCDMRGIDKSYSVDCDIFILPNPDQDPGGEETLIAAAHTRPGEAMLKRYFGGTETDFSRVPVVPEPVFEIDADEADIFEKVDWEALSAPCLSCGTCTFVCPTCHCFDFADKGASRYRVWDSCMYAKFTLHASGHNPRAAKSERFRQRFMHKYVYVRKNIGDSSCFGCGRCTRKCPAGINTKRVLHKIREEAAGTTGDGGHANG
jgi:ferredoxin